MKTLNVTISVALIGLMIGCSPKSDDLVVYPSKNNTFEKSFEFSPSEVTVQQQSYDENTVSVLFQVLKDGKSVGSVSESDLRVEENGVPVTPFKLSAQTERINQVADIVFLVDITGTMVELIETAKKRLAEFIKSSRANGYHTRMCIATFGDYTVKKCSRFFDNNPKDKSTEAQVKELLSELAQLHAFRGNGKDPGWPDLDENPMGALVDVSKAPWGADSQRFVILVTDWGFLYSAGNQGTIGDKAPTMKQVTDAIAAAQMKVFAVTRTQHTHKGQALVWDGYNTPFQGEPGIVQSSGGEHFDFDKVLKGEISLTSILQRILDRLNTNYKLTYVVDQVPGLNPSLNLDKRDVKVAVQNPALGEVTVGTTLSSIPNGRPEYKRNWKVSEEALQADSVQVFVGDTELSKSEYQAQNTDVTFNSVPKPGSKIRFSFYNENFRKHLRLEPMSFSGLIDLSNTKVYLNGIEARPGDVIFAKDLEGNTTLTLSEEVLKINDPYAIRANRGLKMKVTVSFVDYTDTRKGNSQSQAKKN